jgi:hypothetical protein
MTSPKKSPILYPSILGTLILIYLSLPLSALAAEQASATLRLVAVVSPKVKIQLEQETVQIAASTEDLERGYVEIPRAAQLLVWTNSRSGLTLTAQAEAVLRGAKGHTLPISSLSYSFNGGSFQSFRPGEQVIYVGQGREVGARKWMDYRLNLNWSVEPDTYTVNVTYTVTPN